MNGADLEALEEGRSCDVMLAGFEAVREGHGAYASVMEGLEFQFHRR